MKSTRQILRRTLVAALAGLGVSACGGGGSGTQAAAAPSSALDSVPPAASTSVGALIAWASHLPRSDVAEPLSTSTFTPPVDDTAEPTPIM
jgi:hypothetical protein